MQMTKICTSKILNITINQRNANQSDKEVSLHPIRTDKIQNRESNKHLVRMGTKENTFSTISFTNTLSKCSYCGKQCRDFFKNTHTQNQTTYRLAMRSSNLTTDYIPKRLEHSEINRYLHHHPYSSPVHNN